MKDGEVVVGDGDAEEEKGEEEERGVGKALVGTEKEGGEGGFRAPDGGGGAMV